MRWRGWRSGLIRPEKNGPHCKCWWRLRAVLLYPRGAQACETVLVKRSLPGQIFFRGQCITITGFFEAQKAPAYGCNNFGFPPDDPAVASWWWQVRYGQRRPVGADDIVDAGTQLTVSVHTLLLTLTHTGRTTGAYSAQLRASYATGLNFRFNLRKQNANSRPWMRHNGTELHSPGMWAMEMP